MLGISAHVCIALKGALVANSDVTSFRAGRSKRGLRQLHIVATASVLTHPRYSRRSYSLERYEDVALKLLSVAFKVKEGTEFSKC